MQQVQNCECQSARSASRGQGKHVTIDKTKHSEWAASPFADIERPRFLMLSDVGVDVPAAITR